MRGGVTHTRARANKHTHTHTHTHTHARARAHTQLADARAPVLGGRDKIHLLEQREVLATLLQLAF